MLKKILTGTVAVFFAAGLAAASNISLLSGPQDPSQLLNTVNTLIQSINFGVNGRLTAVVTAASNTTSAEQTLATYTLPANRIAATGDAVKIKCWGTTAANVNLKSVKIYFGATSFSSATLGGAPNNKKFILDMMVVRTAAATQIINGQLAMDLTPISIQTSTSGTDSFASNVTIKCTGTGASNSDITMEGMLVEQVK